MKLFIEQSERVLNFILYQIDALIEDLGLSQVKHTRVADLTQSEKQRLNVACHLQLDTDIVILDQVPSSTVLHYIPCSND